MASMQQRQQPAAAGECALLLQQGELADSSTHRDIFGTKHCSDFRLDPNSHLTKADPKYSIFNPDPDNKVHSGATHRLM
jgi:hypothetical protein